MRGALAATGAVTVLVILGCGSEVSDDDCSLGTKMDLAVGDVVDGCVDVVATGTSHGEIWDDNETITVSVEPDTWTVTNDADVTSYVVFTSPGKTVKVCGEGDGTVFVEHRDRDCDDNGVHTCDDASDCTQLQVCLGSLVDSGDDQKFCQQLIVEAFDITI